MELNGNKAKRQARKEGSRKPGLQKLSIQTAAPPSRSKLLLKKDGWCRSNRIFQLLLGSTVENRNRAFPTLTKDLAGLSRRCAVERLHNFFEYLVLWGEPLASFILLIQLQQIVSLMKMLKQCVLVWMPWILRADLFGNLCISSLFIRMHQHM